VKRLAAGFLLPGAAHWMRGQRTKAVIYGAMVLTLVAAGVSLNGANTMPAAAELKGVDGTARLMFLGGATVKAFAGLPYFAPYLAGYSQSFLSGALHEYGTKLLAMAGLVNLLAVADAFTKEAKS
jgi:hypothetical protein